MPRAVATELSTLVAPLPLLRVNLSARWHRWAYMVDACLEGFGVVATAAHPDELRGETLWSERRGWAVRLEDTYSDLESLDVPPLPEPSSMRPAAAAFLELFAGEALLSETVAERCVPCCGGAGLPLAGRGP